ncbi:MAG: helix-turn-helix domain-containing protein [bacterium]|nr:helix-turn-helix domain-containing protein [bacterium]
MPNKEYTISEVAENTGLKQHTLRYWEEELGLEIQRNSAGCRFYTDENIRLFLETKRLKEAGYTLAIIKSMLSKDGKVSETSLGPDSSISEHTVTQDEKEDVIVSDPKEDELQELLHLYMEMIKMFDIPLNVVKESLLDIIQKARLSTVKDEIACTELVSTVGTEENDQSRELLADKLDHIIALQKEMVEVLKEDTALKNTSAKHNIFNRRK